MNTSIPSSAELLIATGCRHCPVILKELTEQLKKGELASLKITNIAVDNRRAEELNVRSVPWFSLSNNNSFMIFSGEHSPKEVQQWLASSQTENGMQEYIEECLGNGQLMTIVQAIQIKPEIFSHILTMIKNEETSMDIRIGLDVLIEISLLPAILKTKIFYKKKKTTRTLRLKKPPLKRWKHWMILLISFLRKVHLLTSVYQ